MTRLIILPSAAADEAEILSYLNEKAGLGIAVRFQTLFRSTYTRLAAFPASGAPRRALGDDVRIAVVAPYIVVYRCVATEGSVSVLRIVHSRRRIAGEMLREPR